MECGAEGGGANGRAGGRANGRAGGRGKCEGHPAAPPPTCGEPSSIRSTDASVRMAKSMKMVSMARAEMWSQSRKPKRVD